MIVSHRLTFEPDGKTPIRWVQIQEDGEVRAHKSNPTYEQLLDELQDIVNVLMKMRK